MKKEIAEKWAEALRSGDYTQGKNYLKRTVEGKTSHCCLGVLCEIYYESNKEENIEESLMWIGELSDKDSIHTFDGSTGALSKKVRNWAGIGSDIGYVKSDLLSKAYLTEMNDGEYSFNDIADFIEKNIDNL